MKEYKDRENTMHVSTFSLWIVSDDFKNVLDDYLHQNCPNFQGSMTTSSLPNCNPKSFLGRFDYFFFEKSFV